MFSAIDNFSSSDDEPDSSESSFAFATRAANKSVESSANSILLFGFFGRPFSFFSTFSSSKWISLIIIFNLLASSSTSSRLIFSFFITFVKCVGAFPFGSRNSIKPASKRCSIVPYSGFSPHFLQYFSSFTTVSHWVYRPWFWRSPPQQFSFTFPENGIGILLFTPNDKHFLSFFSTPTSHTFIERSISSASKLCTSPQWRTALLTKSPIISLITFNNSLFIFNIDIISHLYTSLYISLLFQFFFLQYFLFFTTFLFYPPLKRWSQTTIYLIRRNWKLFKILMYMF